MISASVSLLLLCVTVIVRGETCDQYKTLKGSYKGRPKKLTARLDGYEEELRVYLISEVDTYVTGVVVEVCLADDKFEDLSVRYEDGFLVATKEIVDYDPSIHHTFDITAYITYFGSGEPQLENGELSIKTDTALK